MATNHYKRVVLKLSGEALREKGSRDNISPQIVQELAKQIAEVKKLGIELAIVIGGGNIWRGLTAVAWRDESGDRGLHGHAGHGDKWPRA